MKSPQQEVPLPLHPFPLQAAGENTNRERTAAGYILILQDEYRKVTFLNCLTGSLRAVLAARVRLSRLTAILKLCCLPPTSDGSCIRSSLRFSAHERECLRASVGGRRQIMPPLRGRMAAIILPASPVPYRWFRRGGGTCVSGT